MRLLWVSKLKTFYFIDSIQIIGNTMVVYGGSFQNDTFSPEILGLDLEYHTW